MVLEILAKPREKSLSRAEFTVTVSLDCGAPQAPAAEAANTS
jgi:hypothetical protein